MIALDTNLLVYSHRTDGPHHQAALSALEALARSGLSWAIPWPCIHEFLAIVTHPRIFAPPSTMTVALRAVSDLFDLPGMRPIGESEDHARRLAHLLTRSGVVGPKVHDARLVAICLAHGVRELWTADRDFSFFPELVTRNPLVKTT